MVWNSRNKYILHEVMRQSLLREVASDEREQKQGAASTGMEDVGEECLPYTEIRTICGSDCGL